MAIICPHSFRTVGSSKWPIKKTTVEVALVEKNAPFYRWKEDFSFFPLSVDTIITWPQTTAVLSVLFSAFSAQTHMHLVASPIPFHVLQGILLTMNEWNITSLVSSTFHFSWWFDGKLLLLCTLLIQRESSVLGDVKLGGAQCIVHSLCRISFWENDRKDVLKLNVYMTPGERL